MSLINGAFDIGDLMMIVDENYNEDTNRYNMSVLEADVEDVDAGDPDIDEDIYDDESDDDFLDVSDRMAYALSDAETNWAEKEIDDEVMDMIIDDEDDEMTDDDIEGYNSEYGTEDLLESSLDHLNFNDGYPEDADCLVHNESSTSVDSLLDNLKLL